jgi:hypothetical protein
VAAEADVVKNGTTGRQSKQTNNDIIPFFIISALLFKDLDFVDPMPLDTYHHLVSVADVTQPDYFSFHDPIGFFYYGIKRSILNNGEDHVIYFQMGSIVFPGRTGDRTVPRRCSPRPQRISQPGN